MEFLKKLLGDKYKEDMTIEEINQAVSELDIITRDELSKYVPKTRYDKTASECADYKRKWRETLSAKEQAELELKEAQEAQNEELETLRRESKVSTYEKKYLAMGYAEDKATKIANALYDNDMDIVFDLQNEHLITVKKEVDKKTLENTPTPPAGNGDNKVGKKERNNMSLDELQKLFSEDPTQFEN